MKTKLLTVLLAGLMLLFTACGDKTKQPEANTEPQTDAPIQYLDDLAPTDKYVGTDFRMLVGNPTVENNFLMQDPGETATNLQSASYKSALQLEDRFGITLTYKPMDSYASGYKAFLETITQTSLGGAATAFDVVVPGFWYGLTIAKDYYANLNTLENLDFSKSYWNQEFNKNVEINDCLYACVGDFSLDSITGAYAVVFNQSVLQANGMTSPFDHYDNNTWTLDTMLTMTEEAYNGDIVGSETYGILLSRQSIDSFYTASDLKIYTVNDGDYKLTKYSETAENLYGTFYQLMKKNPACKYSTVIDRAELLDIFMADRALFGCFALAEIQEFRHMKTDYGVIVYPKYTATQEKYISGTTGGGIFCIPKAARDPEMSALVLEAMSASFHKDVMPVLIEITLEGQSVRDQKSSSMISLIIDNIYWDFGFINHTSLGNVANFGIEMENGYSTMKAWYDGNVRTYNSKLAEYLNTYLMGE